MQWRLCGKYGDAAPVSPGRVQSCTREGLTRICFYRIICAAFWQMLDDSCISRLRDPGAGGRRNKRKQTACNSLFLMSWIGFNEHDRLRYNTNALAPGFVGGTVDQSRVSLAPDAHNILR